MTQTTPASVPAGGGDPQDRDTQDGVSAISTTGDDAPHRPEPDPHTGVEADDAEPAIAPGMAVVEADGSHVGTVEAVDGDEIRLARGDGDDGHRLLPASLVDGVSEGRVILRGRGDNAFGVEA